MPFLPSAVNFKGPLNKAQHILSEFKILVQNLPQVKSAVMHKSNL